MTTFVFAGPTITAPWARPDLDVTFLPPVQQGDVYRAVRQRPGAIAIIDGYFEHVPAVWHKEILFAMAEGIAVLGSASMGALRAAELAPFGMIGVGAIFEAFRRGDLEDDDEVAVVHASADDGYRALSEAMVNIRFTLRQAQHEQIIGRPLAQRLTALAKCRYYAERSWPRLLSDAADAGLTGPELDTFCAWLPTGRVDQKRIDAEQLLDLLAKENGPLPAPKVNFRVEHTIWWDRVMRDAGSAVQLAAPGGAVVLGAILDELRLEGESYRQAFQGALIRHAALTTAHAAAAAATSDDVQAAVDRLRQLHQLKDVHELSRWLADNDLADADLLALARDEALITRGHRLLEMGALDALADHLRVTGQWPSLVERARRKQDVLAAAGLDNPGVGDTGCSLLELCCAHARRIAAQAPDGDRDISSFAISLGFGSAGDLARALAREHLFIRMAEA